LVQPIEIGLSERVIPQWLIKHRFLGFEPVEVQPESARKLGSLG
jgi:hypothetical protein